MLWVCGSDANTRSGLDARASSAATNDPSNGLHG